MRGIRALAAVVGIALVPGMAWAGTFDGNWIGQVPPVDKCNQQSVMSITIADDTMVGQVRNPGNVRMLAGKIDADGSASFSVAGPTYRGTMNFTGDHFEGTWFNGNCNRHVFGARKPTPEQAAQLVQQRKDAQALYDDLAAKAVAGDKGVNFATLRSAYPFTRQWDPFGNKTGPLMEQISVAAKGGDCASAMEKLDQVLKVDFTIVAAHKTRSDCLRELGRADEARAEATIADGLAAARSGNGESEKTAYPVMTMREEGDILNEQHIGFRSRQTGIRSSDGHYYEVVHGVSLRNGAAAQLDVHFDVTAQVNARNSAIAASTLPTAAQ